MTSAAVPAFQGFDPKLKRDLFGGILSRRTVAYPFDVVAVSRLWIGGAIVVFFLGIATLGLAWLIYPTLWSLIGLAYTILTVSGRRSATPGMAAMNLTMRGANGERMDALRALAHVCVFYALTVTLTPFIHLVGLFTYRHRLLQDSIAGVWVMDTRAAETKGI